MSINRDKKKETENPNTTDTFQKKANLFTQKFHFSKCNTPSIIGAY